MTHPVRKQQYYVQYKIFNPQPQFSRLGFAIIILYLFVWAMVRWVTSPFFSFHFLKASMLCTCMYMYIYFHVSTCTCMYMYNVYIHVHVYVQLSYCDLLIKDDSITTNCKREGGGRTSLFMGNKSPLTDTYNVHCTCTWCTAINIHIHVHVIILYTYLYRGQQSS